MRTDKSYGLMNICERITDLSPPMAKYYKETYDAIRIRIPLQEGWTADSSTMDAFLTPGYSETAAIPNPHLLRFTKEYRQVQVTIAQVGRLDIEFTDATGVGFTIPEMTDLLKQFLGAEWNLEEELKYYRNARKTFPLPPCPGQPWMERITIRDEVFKDNPLPQGPTWGVPITPLSRATVKGYLDDYRHFREKNPLTRGWTDNTTDLEKYIETEGSDVEVGEPPTLFFRNGTRCVSFEFETGETVYYSLYDSKGHGYSADEIINLLADLVGSFPNPLELAEEWREEHGDFPPTPRRRKPWDYGIRIDNDLFTP